jgi:hypothetical protein
MLSLPDVSGSSGIFIPEKSTLKDSKTGSTNSFSGLIKSSSELGAITVTTNLVILVSPVLLVNFAVAPSITVASSPDVTELPSWKVSFSAPATTLADNFKFVSSQL